MISSCQRECGCHRYQEYQDKANEHDEHKKRRQNVAVHENVRDIVRRKRQRDKQQEWSYRYQTPRPEDEL
eukprot:scaffold2515_cov136-Amphora_coffeaeformis.AAC.3